MLEMLSHRSWNAVVKSAYLLLSSTSVPGLPFTTCAASYRDTAMPRLSYSHSCGVVWCSLCPLSIIPRMTVIHLFLRMYAPCSDCTSLQNRCLVINLTTSWLSQTRQLFAANGTRDDRSLRCFGPLHSSSWRVNEEWAICNTSWT